MRTPRFAMLAALAALSLPVGTAEAKKGEAAHAPSARAVSELAGKFKWGMSPDDCLKIVSAAIQTKYAELIKKEPDTIKQDSLRKEQQEEVDKVRKSAIKFDGRKSGWDVSIIDKEFMQGNSESMVVMWEKDQRRFLFFWNDKLYKQYIAFNAEHPVFAGKSFDDFAKIIQNRYGHAEMKFAQLRTKDDMTLDHLEWPAANDYQLWAIDQSGFYGNFCLKLQQPSVVSQLERIRNEKNPKRPQANALIDSVTTPDQVQGDKNADIVDEITGRHGQRTNQGGGGHAATATSEPPRDRPDKSENKKKSKPKTAPGEADPLEGMKF
jgi:hypothetical protein